MAILKVARMGHPVLRRIAQPVPVKDINTPAFQNFIDDMIETMKEYNGVGLAAPQVHRSQRVSVIEIPDDSRYGKKRDVGLHVFINPVLQTMTTETSRTWEGCLSVPGMRGLVARANQVKVNYLDRFGKSKELVAQGFFAIVLQHEFDHLDGKLYIDRLVDTTKLVYDEEFDRYWAEQAGETLD